MSLLGIIHRKRMTMPKVKILPSIIDLSITGPMPFLSLSKKARSTGEMWTQHEIWGSLSELQNGWSLQT